MRILVITGSRALDCDARPRRWALRQLIDAFARHTPEIVVHGDAIGPDTWADELAAWAGIPRVAWPVGARSPTTRLSNGTRRPLKDAGAYPYSDPLSRNEAMIRWAANQAVSDHPGVQGPGHTVRVVGLRAPWASTSGTAHTLVAARNMDLAVESFEPPSDAWPEDGTAPRLVEDPSPEDLAGIERQRARIAATRPGEFVPKNAAFLAILRAGIAALDAQHATPSTGAST